MLTIGEFSKICEVSTNTLRYYAEVGLILPSEVNQDTGYRYYTIDQLETMLYINRLKEYQFSLDEIKIILQYDDKQNELLYTKMLEKKAEIELQAQALQNKLSQMEMDINHLKQGKHMMVYLKDIEVRLVEMPKMTLLSIRKSVLKSDFPCAYMDCFGRLFHEIQEKHLTMSAYPMVLFHSDEFTLEGLDTEFAVPIKGCTNGTSDFNPGLCLKSTLKGSYVDLPSVYAKQMKWAEREGYENAGPLFECYLNSLDSVTDESELITDVYFPIKKTVHNQD